MPAGIARIQYQFVSQTDALANGWTENFYYSAVSAQQALDAAGSDDYITIRCSILGPDFRMSLIRAVGPGGRSDQAQKVLTPPTGLGRFTISGVPVRTSEQPWDGLLIKLLATPKGVRQFIMRGLPVGVLSDTMAYDPVPGFDNNLRLWKSFIAGTGHPSNFMMRVLSFDVSITLFSATLYNNNRALRLTTGTAPPGWVVPRAVVRLRNAIGVNPSPNRLWRVQDVSQTGVSVWTITLFPGRRFMAGTPDGPLALDQVVAVHNPINVAQEQRGAERKTGRPPAQLRGRARGR